MLIGAAVFVYRNDEGFEAPIPGIITGIYVDAEGLVDVEVFHRKAARESHCVPMERVTFVSNAKEARAAFMRGVKYVCSPYDPFDPKALTEEVEEAKAKSPKK